MHLPKNFLYKIVDEIINDMYVKSCTEKCINQLIILISECTDKIIRSSKTKMSNLGLLQELLSLLRQKVRKHRRFRNTLT